MKQEEFEQILQLLEKIQNVAYERYEETYLPRILEHGGHMHSLPEPMPFMERPMIANSAEATIDRAVQETNVAYVYQLHHAATFRAKLVQNQPPRRTTKQMIIDGVNYMTDMVNELVIGKGVRISENSYKATTQDVIYTLKAILNALQRI